MAGGNATRPAAAGSGASRSSTSMGSPPRGDSVGIWRMLMVWPGSIASRQRPRIIAAIVRISICPKRMPMQVRDPPPNGT